MGYRRTIAVGNVDYKTREVFENVVENTHNNVVLADSEGAILYASPAFRNEFDFSMEVGVSYDIFDMVSPDDVGVSREAYDRAVSTGEKVVVTFRVMLGAKDFSYVEAVISNLLDYDSVNCMLISFRNVSAYKNSVIELENYKDHLEELVEQRTQELRESLEKEKLVIEQQKQFISMVSHEFRTPLTIIDGNAQIIVNRGDKLTQEMLQKRSITIRKAVDRLVGLIERVLSDKVLESGDLDVDLSPCNYAAMVRDISIEKLSITPEAKIRLDIARDIPEIWMDEKLVHQVIVNLISNAFKYSCGEAEVKIKLHLKESNILLEVSDKGVGIPLDELNKIFTKYFRASTAAAIPGTGLGLNLVKQIAELHGGEAFIDSEVDMGTTVTFSLPVKLVDEES